MIDASRADGEAAEKTSSIDATKQTSTHGIRNIDRLLGVPVKSFRMWHTHNQTTVIILSVGKDKEAAFRHLRSGWKPPIRARLIGLK